MVVMYKTLGNRHAMHLYSSREGLNLSVQNAASPAAFDAYLQVGKIGSLDAYFAEPKSTPKAGIMLIHDIHGWDKKNIAMMADKYAEAGAVVIHVHLPTMTTQSMRLHLDRLSALVSFACLIWNSPSAFLSSSYLLAGGSSTYCQESTSDDCFKQ